MYLTKAEKKFLKEIETVPFSIERDGHIITQKEKFNKAVEENLDKKDKEYCHSPYCKSFDRKKDSYYRRVNIFQKIDRRLHPNHYPPYEIYYAIKIRQTQYANRLIEKQDLKVQRLGIRNRHRIFKKNYIKVDIPKKESK